MTGVRSKFAAAFADKRVCVAGAGGYIGSALVKALAPEGLHSMVLLDSSEYGLFEIQRWMAEEYPAVFCKSILGSVGDEGLVGEMFQRSRPEVVFHAAAFKHVGMLERNPLAAIGNNALGSYIFAKAAVRHGVSQFVLISTDKAVNPHSVMGVSKRLAELFTLSFDGTNAIRLGNVMGSPGSVVPLFLEQVKKGGVVSITHPEASRYFLTRDQAVDAILAAGLAGYEGTVFLPEFAEPVRIVDLAKSLMGDQAAQLRFIGLRPGEKVSEDLVSDDETEMAIVAGPLRVIRTRRLSHNELDYAVGQLSARVANRDTGTLLDALCEWVPEYVPSKLMLECATVAH